MDPTRLDRIDRRLARWVDDGQLPGFLVTVARRGRLVHVGRYGHRDVENGLPVDRRHPLAHLLDDQAGHLGRGDDAVRGGRLRAQRPDLQVAARVRRDPRLRRRVGDEAGHRPAGRADPGVAPAHAHVRAHLRLPPRAPGRRDVPRDGSRVGHPPRRRLRRGLPQWASIPLVVPARHRVELRRLHRRPGPPGRGDVRAAARRVLRAADLRAPRHARHVVRPARGRRPESLARLYGPSRAARRPATGLPFIEAFDAAAHTKPAFLSGGGGLVSTAGDYLRFIELLRRRGSYDGGRLLGPRTSRTWSATTCPATPTSRASAGRCSPRRRCAGWASAWASRWSSTRCATPSSPMRATTAGAARPRRRSTSTRSRTSPSASTRLLPSSTLPIRTYLRALVNQTLVD